MQPSTSTGSGWGRPSSNTALAQHPAMGGLSAELHAAQQRHAAAQGPGTATRGGAPADGALYGGPGPGGRNTRVHVCTKDDSLRTVRD